MQNRTEQNRRTEKLKLCWTRTKHGGETHFLLMMNSCFMQGIPVENTLVGLVIQECLQSRQNTKSWGCWCECNREQLSCVVHQVALWSCWKVILCLVGPAVSRGENPKKLERRGIDNGLGNCNHCCLQHGVPASLHDSGLPCLSFVLVIINTNGALQLFSPGPAQSIKLYLYSLPTEKITKHDSN